MGCSIPPKFSFEHLLGSPRFALQKTLLQLPGAQSQDYTEQVGDVLALLRGTYRSAEGAAAHVIPGEGADVQVWILGSSGGESAQVAGANGLRFAANYHVSPATVLEAADGYRATFRPSSDLDRPYVSVSADVVVAGDEASARELAAGDGAWVRSIRSGRARSRSRPRPRRARTVERRGPRPDRRPGGHPVRRVRETGRRPAGAASGGHRRGRADHHHHHARPRGPGPLLPAARGGMEPPVGAPLGSDGELQRAGHRGWRRRARRAAAAPATPAAPTAAAARRPGAR